MVIRKFELKTKEEIMADIYHLLLNLNDEKAVQNITEWFTDMNRLVEGGEAKNDRE